MIFFQISNYCPNPKNTYFRALGCSEKLNFFVRTLTFFRILFCVLRKRKKYYLKYVATVLVKNCEICFNWFVNQIAGNWKSLPSYVINASNVNDRIKSRLDRLGDLTGLNTLRLGRIAGVDTVTKAPHIPLTRTCLWYVVEALNKQQNKEDN